MKDYTKGLDDDTLQRSMDNRNSTVKRPDLDPGMADDDDDFGSFGSFGSSKDDDDDDFGSFGSHSFGSRGGFGGDDDDDFESFGRGHSFGGSSFGNNSFGGSSFGNNSFGNSPFGNGGSFSSGPGSAFGSQFGGMGMQGQQQQPRQSAEEQMFDNGVKAIKTAGVVGIDFIKSFKSFDALKKMNFGKTILKVSAGVAILGVILFILNLTKILKLPGFGLNMIVGALFAMGVGIPIFMSNYDKVSSQPTQSMQPANQGFAPQNNNNFDNFDSFDDSFDDDFGKHSPSPFSGDLGDEDDFSKTEKTDKGFSWDDLPDDDFEEPSGFTDSDSKFSSFEADFGEKEEVETKDFNDAMAQIETLDENQSKYMTRQFLFDNMMSVMESKTKDFAKSEELPEDSRQFAAIVTFVDRASDIIKGKSEIVPQVISVRDKLFYTLITLSRPNWLNSSKLNQFVEEIVAQYATDPETFERDDSVSGTGSLYGDKVIIKIIKGETATITVKDIFTAKKDEILDLKNKMPVVIGIDAEGAPVIADFLNMHSLLIAGAPRSGKSWTLKAILAQLMMFNDPSQIQFYFVDPKGITSDFFTVECPHVKTFISSNDKVIDLFKHFCEDEAKRRADMLYKLGAYKDIKDMKKEHPEVDMPYVCLVIDEIVSVTQSMDKETRARFYEYLRGFTTRLPNLGIRLIIVPHLVKNQVVDKTVTDMIKNRMCVRGTAGDIESILEVKEKQFPYKLNFQGDMAVHIDGLTKGATFVHSAIVSTTNDGYDKFFTYLTNFWLKMKPESFKGSKLEKDIKAGYQQINDYPILETILTDEDRDALMSVPNPTAARKGTANPSASRPRPKSRIVDMMDMDDSDSKVYLSQQEQEEILKGVHDSVRKGIEKDDTFY